MINTIKLVVFDLGGTVFSKGKQAFIGLLARKLDVDREKVVDAVDGPHAIQYRRNEISANVYWKKVKDTLYIPSEFGNLETMWFDQYIPIPGIPELIAKLRRHYKVAYLSNNIPERVTYLHKKYNFLDWFDGGLFSYEIGAIKTDSGTYEMLIAKFEKIQPEQTLIIDDRKQNLEQPAQAGFTTLLFQNFDQLQRDLKGKRVLEDES